MQLILPALLEISEPLVVVYETTLPPDTGDSDLLSLLLTLQSLIFASLAIATTLTRGRPSNFFVSSLIAGLVTVVGAGTVIQWAEVYDASWSMSAAPPLILLFGACGEVAISWVLAHKTK